MAKVKNSKKGKGSYAAYATQNRASKNHKEKLQRHLKNHPNDDQAKTSLKSGHKQKSAPRNKGNFPEQKIYVYDGAGRKYLLGSYTPEFMK